MEICAYQTIDKGKGFCYGIHGERWYHLVDNLRFVMEPSSLVILTLAPHQCMVNVPGIEKGI